MGAVKATMRMTICGLDAGWIQENSGETAVCEDNTTIYVYC